MIILMNNTFVLLRSKKKEQELEKYEVVEQKENYFTLKLKK